MTGPAAAGGATATPVGEATSLGLSVVVPAFDERLRLPSSLERICAYLKSVGRLDRSEILVVDDGSRDGTADLASDWPEPTVRFLRLEENRGKGAALRTGVLASRGDLVLLCDADLSTPIEDLERLEARLEEAPVVFGSRARPESAIGRRQPWYRNQMGKTFNRLLWLLGVRGVRDTQCGFKLLRGDVARRLFERLTIDRFAYDVELLLAARAAGHEVVEVGVRWDHVEESRVHPVRDAARMLYDVARLRLRQILSPGTR
ncbi:MAG: glycosyltransferase family 2 protein [Acidobacteria bacterium]|nr:MAG: glycosyltransferase family 2 protein [Acidobacteriota bacterium]REK05644.1 MAG: glycosyltransferase family 2 protein [Acidobacteriota bacterium]